MVTDEKKNAARQAAKQEDAPQSNRFIRTFARLAEPCIIPAGGKSDGLRLVFDLESDGLLNTATTVHCIVIADLDSDQIDEYGPDRIAEALERLKRADYLTGHNIVGFDLPLLRRLHGWAPPAACKIVDTLVVSRLILPHLDDLDDRATAMSKVSLGKMRGRYSLEAWGARLGMPKVGADIEDWSTWTPEMQARCVGDVQLTMALWRFLQPDGQRREALELEHRVSAICSQITADGMPFDIGAAEELRAHWEARRSELEAQLRSQFPEITNLNSRIQIGAALEARGWKPERRTEKTGAPAIDDELLEMLPTIYPEFEGLAEHYILGRRLGQLANGAQAWLKNVKPDGRIHGGLIHIGTPHSRAKHLQPNMAQVPSHKKGAPFAAECRALFRHAGDWVFIGADQSNLQDRAFGHYLAEHDGGAFARTFAEGIDQHWKTASALGLVLEGEERDKTNKVHTAIREGSKTFRYAFLFGAGGARLGHITGDTVRAVQCLNAGGDLRQRIFGGAEHPGEEALKRVGRNMLARFIQATPGLMQLRESLKAQFRRSTWLPGLDGRRVPGGADYKTLNRIVTSSEAIICKRWLIQVYDELCERFNYGWEGDVVITAWIHDEIVCCCRPEIAEQAGEILVRHAKAAGEHYRFRCPLAAEYTIGRDWAGNAIDATPDVKEDTARADGELDGRRHGAGDRHGGEPSPRRGAPDQDGGAADRGDLRKHADGDAGLEGEEPEEGAAPGSTAGDHDDQRRPWAKPAMGEPLPSSAEFEEILAGLSAENQKIARHRRPAGPQANGGGADRVDDQAPGEETPPHSGARATPRGNGHAAADADRNGDGYPHGEHDDAGADRGRPIVYIYRNARGERYLAVKRTPGKQFPQYHWDGARWLKGKPKGPKIPYRLPELLGAELDAWTLICAGEKDAESAAALGFVATTNSEGESPGKWTPDLNAWFVGRKRVAVMEDNDVTGRAHAIEVVKAMRSIGVPDVRVITFREIAEHGDLSDWIGQGHGKEDLQARIEAAKPYRFEPQPAPIREWDGQPAPELEYAVPDRFPMEDVALFSGEGGHGKSTLVQQLCVAHVLGNREWLGCIPRQGPAIYLECEDSLKVLHWRMMPLADHYGVSLTEIADAGFQMFSLADEETSVLATAPDRSGIVRPTPLYDWLYEMAGDIKPVMIGIASSATVFAGNENVRTEVQQFIQLLRRITRVSGGGLLLITHPSLTGIGDGSASHAGLSGTTQWHNAVRARASMRINKSEDGLDTGMREIKFHKNQYGSISASCFVRWQNGLFLPVEGLSMDAAERAAKAEEVFIALLKKIRAQGREVNHKAGSTYAPKVFAEQPDAQEITKKEFKAAMERLLDAGAIKVEDYGKASRPAYRLVVVAEG